MMMRIKGSMRRGRGQGVATSSSKNSATELSMAVERRSARRRDHLSSEVGKTRVCKRASARGLPSRTVVMEPTTALETRRTRWSGSGFKGGHEGQAAGEQRGESAGKESDLVFEPDSAEYGSRTRKLSMKSWHGWLGRSDRARRRRWRRCEDPEDIVIDPAGEVEQDHCHFRKF